MKKLGHMSKLLAVLGLTFSLVAVGCSSQSSQPGSESKPSESQSSGNEAGSGSAEPEFVFKFSHNQPIDSPEHTGAQAFKERVEKESNGRVKVEVYPASQLGSLREQVEGTQMGSIHMTMQPAAVITPFVDDVKVVDFPYLWPKDEKAGYEVLDGELGKELLTKLQEKGFEGLGYWPGGFKLFTTSNKEIHLPADFAGLKIRVMESPLLIEQYKTWGANPVPLPYAELYNSLQQGVVDGQENPLQTIYLNKFYEVQKNVIQSYHGTMTYITMANKAWFDGLPEDVQKIVRDAEESARNVAREDLAKRNADYVTKIKETGVNFYELTDEEIAAFKEASKPIHDKMYDKPEQKDYLNRLYKAIEEAEKK